MLKPIWGAATSAHQVEGGNQWNDWWAWEQAGKVSEPSGKACDHYRLFREDFQLARSLGHTAHRFSLEWSRLEPTEGEWNEEAFRHYEEVLETLHSEGLEPVVTLHHFTNPLWFNKKGGWLQPDAPQKFVTFVKRAVERYSRRIRFWITINEPLIYVYQGMILGRWPPGEKSLKKAHRVYREMMRAHALCYEVIHRLSQNQECWVSLAHHMIAFTPCRKQSFLDRGTLFLRDWFVNRLPFQSLLTGFLFYPGVFLERLPAKRTLDFLGVNYYSRDFIHFGGFFGANQLGVVCPKEHHPEEVLTFNALGWEIYPEGIYQAISSLKHFGLPILITENGVCTDDDTVRQRYIESHLTALDRTRREGALILGYLYWSLVDNFEWAEGFKPRFGIVEVDYATQRRRPRPSAATLKKCCEKIFIQT